MQEGLSVLRAPCMEGSLFPRGIVESHESLGHFGNVYKGSKHITLFSEAETLALGVFTRAVREEAPSEMKFFFRCLGLF